MDLAWLEERALRYAARWEASAAGVASLLERKIVERCEQSGESAEGAMRMIPEVVTELIERGYVDDRRFAAEILDRQRRRGDSATRIRARLRAKGVADSLLDELFAQEDPDSEIRAAWRLARRRGLGPYCSDLAKREKARDQSLGILCRQGFEHETALGIVDADVGPELA